MADELEKIILGDTAISAIEGQPGSRRFFRRKDRQSHPPPTHCENCGAKLHGHWCAQCGQPAVDYRRSLRHVLADLLNEFLNWDSKFFVTVYLLLTKPWKLTNDFIAGRRVRYVHPLRVYLLASILFFFGATYAIKSTHFSPINLSPEDRAQIRNELEQENIAPEIRAKVEAALGGVPLSSHKRAVLEKELNNENLPEEAQKAIREQLQYGNLPPNARAKMEEAVKDLPPDARAKVEDTLTRSRDRTVLFDNDKNVSPNSTEKWLEKRAREKFGEHGTNIQLFLVTLMSNLPYMMLVCIPLFAIVLKILYMRRRIFYIDHLIYALHIHSFAYLGVMVLVLATIGIERAAIGTLGGLIIAPLWTAFAIQIFLSIRKVYRQGWFISVFKFFFGGFVYLIVLVSALFVTFLATLAMP